MSAIQAKVAILGTLGFVLLGRRAHAKVDTVAASVPPPPGELILKFPDDIPASYDRVSLHFFGTVNSNGYSAHTRFTWTQKAGQSCLSQSEMEKR